MSDESLSDDLPIRPFEGTVCDLCLAQRGQDEPDYLLIPRPRREGTWRNPPPYPVTFCLDCAALVAAEYRKAFTQIGSRCEHGVKDGDWCPECREDYRRAECENAPG